MSVPYDPLRDPIKKFFGCIAFRVKVYKCVVNSFGYGVEGVEKEEFMLDLGECI